MADGSAPTAPAGAPHAPHAPLAAAWPDRDGAKGDPARSSLLYRIIVRWTCLLVRAYYRVDVRGEEFEEDAPTLLVQNHTNGLVDAHLLMVSTTRPIRVLVKYKLMTTPFIGWILRSTGAVPMYRKKDGVDTRQNAKSFSAIDRALRDDRSVIALFPEGESLDAIGLRSLRTGVARMAISAETSEHGPAGVRIVPTGATYERRDRIRTLISLLVGPPVDVAEVLEDARAKGLDERAAIQHLMNRIEESMSALILCADTEEEYEAAVGLARLLPHHGAPLGVTRRAALEALRSDGGADAARRRELVTDLGQRLEAARLTGDDVLAPAPGLGAVWVPRLWLVPLGLVALLVMGVPFLLGQQIGKLRRSPDKLVSLRCMFAFATFLLWAPVLLLVGALLQGWTGALTALALVLLGHSTYVGTLDGWLRTRSARARRALAASGEDVALGEALRSIRSAFGAA